MNRRTVGRSGGRIIFGLVLLAVGGYYFLRNTLGFDLGELDDQAVWPVIVVVLGAWIVFRGVALNDEDPAPR
jgi:LiaI-LiaF-like transmembrane region